MPPSSTWGGRDSTRLEVGLSPTTGAGGRSHSRANTSVGGSNGLRRNSSSRPDSRSIPRHGRPDPARNTPQCSRPEAPRLRHRRNIFTFLYHRAIDAAIRPAEPAIRPAVCHRKRFSGNRFWSAAAQERLGSFFATCGKNAVVSLGTLSRFIGRPVVVSENSVRGGECHVRSVGCLGQMPLVMAGAAGGPIPWHPSC